MATVGCAQCTTFFWSRLEGKMVESVVPSLLCRDFALTGHCALLDDVDEDGQPRLHDGMMLTHEPLGALCHGCKREILMEEFDLATSSSVLTTSVAPDVRVAETKAGETAEKKGSDVLSSPGHFPVSILKSERQASIKRLECRVSFSRDAAGEAISSATDSVSESDWTFC